MHINVLFIEDSAHKRSRVLDHINSLGQDISVTEAFSFTSGCQAIEDGEYAVVLLDMSLPTYDKIGAESGGKFRTFGGREIARKILRRSIQTKMVFITQYQSFSDRGRSLSYEELKAELKEECGRYYGGMIFYDSSKLAWKEQLSEAIMSITDENTNS